MNMNTNDGINFYIQGWEPEGETRAVLGLLHGLGEHTGRYENVGKALNEAGYALVGFDLRGHGKTDGARGHFPSLNAVMEDVKQFISFLGDQFPDTPVFLYGHSLGGLLALSYALQQDSEMKGVIVTGAALRSALQEQKAKVAMANVLGSLVPMITIPSGLDVTALSHDPDVIKAYTADPLVHNRTSLGLGKAALASIELCFQRAGEFKYPLLLMHGVEDRIAYPSGSVDFARLAGKTNQDVTLKLWDDMYHEIHNETQKDDVFKFMIAWLDRHVK